MTIKNSRAKGNKSVNATLKYLRAEYPGWMFSVVEKTGKFQKNHDLFSDTEVKQSTGFDLIGISTGPSDMILVQVSTNNLKTLKWYKEFQDKYQWIKVLLIARVDGAGRSSSPYLKLWDGQTNLKYTKEIP